MKNIIRELESTKEIHENSRCEHIIIELENSVEGFSSRLDTYKERISDLKDVSWLLNLNHNV